MTLAMAVCGAAGNDTLGRPAENATPSTITRNQEARFEPIRRDVQLVHPNDNYSPAHPVTAYQGPFHGFDLKLAKNPQLAPARFTRSTCSPARGASIS